MCHILGRIYLTAPIEDSNKKNELPADVELFNGCLSDSGHTLSNAFLDSTTKCMVDVSRMFGHDFHT